MNSNKPLGLYFKHKPDIRTNQEDAMLPMSNKVIGIEIEAENVPYVLDDISQKLFYWDLTTDGSLRNYGAEFITRKLRGKDISLAIDELTKCLEENKITPEYSDRTSVHVHVDARYMYFNQLKSLILLYLLYEPLFFSYVGKGRARNNYCIPYFRSSSSISNLSSLFKEAGEENLPNVVALATRYEAMNLKSMDAHGSIEFRHHYGTHNKTQLMSWISALLCMFNECKSVSVAELIERIKTIPYVNLVERINNYLKVPNPEKFEQIALYSCTSLLSHSI